MLEILHETQEKTQRTCGKHLLHDNLVIRWRCFFIASLKINYLCHTSTFVFLFTKNKLSHALTFLWCFFFWRFLLLHMSRHLLITHDLVPAFD